MLGDLMHSRLFVCLHRRLAKTSLQARKHVFAELIREGFNLQLRFGGVCDWFVIGGRWSGCLTHIQLEKQYPKQFKSYVKKYGGGDKKTKLAERAFVSMFPDFADRFPFNRSDLNALGHQDDAQIMNSYLFHELQNGFSEDLDCWSDGHNVIFAEDPESPTIYPDMPETDEAAQQFWVVVIDYHHM